MSLVYKRAATNLICKRCYTSKRSYSTSQPELHDLVVVGGGPAGLALTAALGEPQLFSQRVAYLTAEWEQLHRNRFPHLTKLR